MSELLHIQKHSKESKSPTGLLRIEELAVVVVLPVWHVFATVL